MQAVTFDVIADLPALMSHLLCANLIFTLTALLAAGSLLSSILQMGASLVAQW